VIYISPEEENFLLKERDLGKFFPIFSVKFGFKEISSNYSFRRIDDVIEIDKSY
jgi:hypothetical protein